MKTLKQIEDICSRESNIGMSEEEYNDIWDEAWEAWEAWDDVVTCEFWEGDQKPEQPTNSFIEDFFRLKEKTKHLEQITRRVEGGIEWLHSSEIIDNPDTLEGALKEIGAEYVEHESGIYAKLEDLERAEKWCVKEDAIIGINFTKEEYDKKAVGKDYETFDEFIDAIVERAIEDGCAMDVVSIANDAYDEL